MSEMQEIKYPILPMAPLVDEGQGYRLQKINEIQNFSEGEMVKREALSKKYLRAVRIVDNIDTVLITVTLAAGAGGISLLSTVVALPAVIAIESVAAVTGLLSLVGKYAVRNLTTKAEKREKIKTIADTK